MTEKYFWGEFEKKSTCVKFGKKSCQLYVSGTPNKRIHIWHVNKKQPVVTLLEKKQYSDYRIEEVEFTSDESQIVAGTSIGKVHLWSLEKQSIVVQYDVYPLDEKKNGSVTSLKFHPFGNYFASASEDKYLKVWDSRANKCLQRYKGHEYPITTIGFTPDGRWLLSGDTSGIVKLWDLTIGKPITQFNDHKDAVTSFGFHPEDKYVAVSSVDGTVSLRFLGLDGKSKRRRVKRHSAVYHCMFDHVEKGKKIYLGLENGFEAIRVLPDKMRVERSKKVEWNLNGMNDMILTDGEDRVWTVCNSVTSIKLWTIDLTEDNENEKGANAKEKENLVNMNEKKIDFLAEKKRPKKGGEFEKSDVSMNLIQQPMDLDDEIINIKKENGNGDPIESGISKINIDFPLDNVIENNRYNKKSEELENNTKMSERDVLREKLKEKREQLKKKRLELQKKREKEWKDILEPEVQKELGLENSQKKISPKKKSKKKVQVKSKIDNSWKSKPKRRYKVGTFIPSTEKRKKSIGLKVDDFLKNSISEKSDQEIIDKLLQKHYSAVGVLKKRHATFKSVKILWFSDGKIEAIKKLEKSNDIHSAVGIFDIIYKTDLKSVNLDIFKVMLVVQIKILKSSPIRPEYVRKTVLMISKLVDSFMNIIRSNVREIEGYGRRIDINREDRIVKCQSIRKLLLEVEECLKDVKRKTEVVNPKVKGKMVKLGNSIKRDMEELCGKISILH